MISQIYHKNVVHGFDQFVQKYIEPTYWDSHIVIDRFKLRNSNKLNNLLLDNEQGLKIFFNYFKTQRNGFTLDSANKFISLETVEIDFEKAIDKTKSKG